MTCVITGRECRTHMTIVFEVAAIIELSSMAQNNSASIPSYNIGNIKSKHSSLAPTILSLEQPGSRTNNNVIQVVAASVFGARVIHFVI